MFTSVLIETFDETGFDDFAQKHQTGFPVLSAYRFPDGTPVCCAVCLDETGQTAVIVLAVSQNGSDDWQLLGIWTLAEPSFDDVAQLLHRLIASVYARGGKKIEFSFTETETQPYLYRQSLQNAGFSEPVFEQTIYKLNIAKMPKDLFAFELSDEERHGYEFYSFAEVAVKGITALPSHPDGMIPFKPGYDADLSLFMVKENRICGWCIEQRLSLTTAYAHTIFIAENEQSVFAGGLLFRALFRRHIVNMLSAFIVFPIDKERRSMERFVKRHFGQYILDCRQEYSTSLCNIATFVHEQF
jgi:hypothetical protein